MDELKAHAMLQELNTVGQILTQRCVDHAGERAEMQARIKTLTEQVEKQAAEIAELKTKQVKPTK